VPNYVATIAVKLEGDNFEAALRLAREVANEINDNEISRRERAAIARTTCAEIVYVVREEESEDLGGRICASPGCERVLPPLRYWGANPPDRCSTCA
jgi:hypothetical protein